MKEIVCTDTDLVKREFENGNIYHLIKNHKSKEVGFTIVLNVDRLGLKHKSYSCGDNLRYAGESYTNFDDWGWHNCRFYILTPEEAASYIKEIIVNNLEAY